MASRQNSISEVLVDLNMTKNPSSRCTNTTSNCGGRPAADSYRAIGFSVGQAPQPRSAKCYATREHISFGRKLMLELRLRPARRAPPAPVRRRCPASITVGRDRPVADQDWLLVTGLPDPFRTYQVPPKLVSPWPLATPEPESPEKVYSGQWL